VNTSPFQSSIPQLNPLGDDFLSANAESSLVPVTHRRLSQAQPQPHTTRKLDHASGEGDEADQASPRAATPSASDKVPLLGPPLPPLLSPDESSSHGMLTFADAITRPVAASLEGVPGTAWKTLKSCLLVAKVSEVTSSFLSSLFFQRVIEYTSFNYASFFPDKKVLSMTYLCHMDGQGGLWRTFVLSTVLGAAVFDTVVDGLWSSVSLGILHLVVLLGCSKTICCG